MRRDGNWKWYFVSNWGLSCVFVMENLLGKVQWRQGSGYLRGGASRSCRQLIARSLWGWAMGKIWLAVLRRQKRLMNAGYCRESCCALQVYMAPVVGMKHYWYLYPYCLTKEQMILKDIWGCCYSGIVGHR